jgi:hypothetical protein
MVGDARAGEERADAEVVAGRGREEGGESCMEFE